MTGSADLRDQFARDPWPVVGFLTAEHTSLTSSRAATVAEGNARVSSFLATLSAALVALGFVAAGSDGFGRGFFGFGAALLATCWLVGSLTFRRCVQVSVEDLHMLSRLERVRRTYLDLVPGLAPSFDVPTLVGSEAAHPESADRSIRRGAPPWRQVLLTMAGLVGVVNSVVLGAAVACAVRATTGAAAAAWAVGAALTLAGVVVHVVVQMHLMSGRWDARRTGPDG